MIQKIDKVIVMDKVIDIESLYAYKEVAKRLKENNISYNKLELLKNPELCKEIIVLMDYFDKEA